VVSFEQFGWVAANDPQDCSPRATACSQQSRAVAARTAFRACRPRWTPLPEADGGTSDEGDGGGGDGGPDANGSTVYGDLIDLANWSTFDATTIQVGARGFTGGAFDGRYVYFSPSYNGTLSGLVARVDTQGNFQDGTVARFAAKAPPSLPNLPAFSGSFLSS
jgi:hypothetical protein